MIVLIGLLQAQHAGGHALDQSYLYLVIDDRAVSGRVEMTMRDINTALDLSLPVDDSVSADSTMVPTGTAGSPLTRTTRGPSNPHSALRAWATSSRSNSATDSPRRSRSRGLRRTVMSLASRRAGVDPFGTPNPAPARPASPLQPGSPTIGRAAPPPLRPRARFGARRREVPSKER